MGRCMQKFAKLSNLSVAGLWRLVSKPWKIPLLLTAPPVLSKTDAILSLFPDLTPALVETCRLELLRNNKFFADMDKDMVEKRHRRTDWRREKYEFLYMAVRFAKPQIVFETGVFDGQSSAVILQALDDIGDGMLVSVDLPANEAIQESTHLMRETLLPPNCQPGWVVPDYLRERYHLVLGDSKELLPQLFKEYSKIDIFFHDSLHTFEHQYFEYTIAWPHLSERGLLVSDDILWSPAFHRFCKEKRKAYVRVGSCGALRK